MSLLTHIARVFLHVIGIGIGLNFSAAAIEKGPTELSPRARAEESLACRSILPIEGIWEYPAEEISLLIEADLLEKGRFGIYVIESVDCRLSPGLRIGSLQATPDPDQFRITLYSSTDNKAMLTDERTGAARLTENDEALLISMPTIKLKITPSILLPSLWNRLRIGVRVHTDNPTDNLPEGWIRSFPSYDGNGSRRSEPRYL